MMELLFSCGVYVLPYLVLELFAFRYRLRFSPGIVIFGMMVLFALEAGLGLWVLRGGSVETACVLASAVYLIYFALMVDDPTGKVMFAVLMIANHGNLVNALGHCLELWLLDQPMPMFSWQSSVILLGVELVMLLPMFCYVRSVYARFSQGQQQVRSWQYLWLIPLIFHVIRFSFLESWTYTPQDLAGALDNLLMTALLSLGNVLVYIMVRQLILEHEAVTLLREKEHMLIMQQAQFDHLQERIEEARRARHDLRHHLHLVSAYLADGKLEELKEYLSRYTQTINDNERIVYCGHYAANALLNYFSWQARQSGVGFESSVQLDQDVGISSEALTVVLGNLLENALHSCQEQRDVPTEILVRGHRDDTAVFFQVVNTCTRPATPDPDGRLRSTKSGGQGIGLTSVEHIAQTYDGMIKVEQSQDRFTVSIMLTIPEEEA